MSGIFNWLNAYMFGYGQDLTHEQKIKKLEVDMDAAANDPIAQANSRAIVNSECNNAIKATHNINKYPQLKYAKSATFYRRDLCIVQFWCHAFIIYQ